MSGPPVFPAVDPSLRADGFLGYNWPVGEDSAKTWRRSVYVKVKRSLLLPQLEVFDCPEITSSVPQRNTTTTPTQALMLLNDPLILRQAGLFGKVETDVGPHGWEEATLERKQRTAAQAVTDLEPFLLGEDPTRIEHLWQTLYRQGFWRGGVVLDNALSGIDQALWDLAGKAYGVPVYRLLGGPVRDRVRLYAHGGVRAVPSIRAAGFTAVKCGPGVATSSP